MNNIVSESYLARDLDACGPDLVTMIFLGRSLDPLKDNLPHAITRAQLQYENVKFTDQHAWKTFVASGYKCVYGKHAPVSIKPKT